jgi:hypothetical protein
MSGALGYDIRFFDENDRPAIQALVKHNQSKDRR